MGSFTLKCKCMQLAHIACGRIKTILQGYETFCLQTATNSWQYSWHQKGNCKTYINPWSQRSPRQMPILAKITGNNKKLLTYDRTGKSLSSNNLSTYWGPEKSPIRMVDNGINCVFLCLFVFTDIYWLVYHQIQTSFARNLIKLHT